MSEAAILLIDAGNTRIKLGVLVPGMPMQTLGSCDTTSSSGAIAALLSGRVFARAIGVCVAGDSVRETLQTALGAVPLQWLTGNTVLPGLSNGYATPHTLGADRWLAAYGLANKDNPRKTASVLATFGTATTVDVVHWDAQQPGHVFAGGIIIAGLATAWHSVSHSTAKLPDVNVQSKQLLAANPSANAIPNSTQSALQLGAIFAQIGAVLQITARVQAAHGDTALFIAGGAATFIAPYLPQAIALETPVLLGLAAAVKHLP